MEILDIYIVLAKQNGGVMKRHSFNIFFLALAVVMCSFIGCSVMMEDFKNMKEEVSYKVKLNFESLDKPGVYDEALAKITTLSGITGKMTEAAADPVKGFDLKEFKQEAIKADGSTVINIYYNRKIINLIFYAYSSNGENREAVWKDTGSNLKLVSGRYGAEISHKDIEFVDYQFLDNGDWSFGGWDRQIPATFGAEDQTFHAQWVLQTTSTIVNFAGNQDIGLSGSKTATNAVLTATIPYSADTWTFQWYCDGNLMNGYTAREISVPFTTLGVGVHRFEVVAKQGSIAFTSTLSLSVESVE